MSEQLLSFEEAMQLFERGLIGTIEFRNWLARSYHDFESVRDTDVDDDIRNMASLRKKKLEAEALLGNPPSFQ